MTLIYKQDRMPGVVLGIFQDLGWEEFDEKVHSDDEWNVHWKPTRYAFIKRSSKIPELQVTVLVFILHSSFV